MTLHYEELARQQEAEARKQQEDEDEAADNAHSAASEGPQSSKYNENDDIENGDEVKVQDTIVYDATDDDAQSVASAEAENSKYESEEETE